MSGSRLFPEKKVQWLQDYENELRRLLSLNDQSQVNNYILSRQSLQEKGSRGSFESIRPSSEKISQEKIVEILNDIDQGDFSKYRYDMHRIQKPLFDCGFTERDIACMAVSDKLRYEALIFEAETLITRGSLTEVSDFSNSYDPLVLSDDQLVAAAARDDKNSFIEIELGEIKRKIIGVHFEEQQQCVNEAIEYFQDLVEVIDGISIGRLVFRTFCTRMIDVLNHPGISGVLLNQLVINAKNLLESNELNDDAKAAQMITFLAKLDEFIQNQNKEYMVLFCEVDALGQTLNGVARVTNDTCLDLLNARKEAKLISVTTAIESLHQFKDVLGNHFSNIVSFNLIKEKVENIPYVQNYIEEGMTVAARLSSGEIDIEQANSILLHCVYDITLILRQVEEFNKLKERTKDHPFLYMHIENTLAKFIEQLYDKQIELESVRGISSRYILNAESMLDQLSIIKDFEYPGIYETAVSIVMQSIAQGSNCTNNLKKLNHFLVCHTALKERIQEDVDVGIDEKLKQYLLKKLTDGFDVCLIELDKQQPDFNLLAGAFGMLPDRKGDALDKALAMRLTVWKSSYYCDVFQTELADKIKSISQHCDEYPGISTFFNRTGVTAEIVEAVIVPALTNSNLPIARLAEKNQEFDLSLQKFKVATAMCAALKNENPEAALNDFKAEYVNQINTIQKSDDSVSKRFLHAVKRIFAFLLGKKIREHKEPGDAFSKNIYGIFTTNRSPQKRVVDSPVNVQHQHKRRRQG